MEGVERNETYEKEKGERREDKVEMKNDDDDDDDEQEKEEEEE